MSGQREAFAAAFNSFMQAISAIVGALKGSKNQWQYALGNLLSDSVERLWDFYHSYNSYVGNLEDQTDSYRSEINSLKYELESVKRELGVLKAPNMEQSALKLMMDKLHNAYFAIIGQGSREFSEADHSTVALIHFHMKAGHWIDAIKQIRTLWGLGLKEAKDIMEYLRPGYER